MSQEYHSFKVELATFILPDGKQVGVENAIFLQDMAYWCDYNKSSNANFRDGRYWTYSTVEELCNRHPYWTQKQIRRIISSCEESGLLISGNFNQNQYDRTKWYAVSDTVVNILQGKCNCPNGQMDLPKQADGTDQMGKSIKYNKENTETNTEKIIYDERLKTVLDRYENSIGVFPPNQTNVLIDFINFMGVNCCLRAVDIALGREQRAHNWPYIKAILQDKRNKNVRCIEDWDKLEHSKKLQETAQATSGIKTVPTYHPDWYDEFMAVYPKRVAIPEAVEAWDNLKPDRELVDTIIKAVKAQKITTLWKEPKYIPTPAKWLNGARWLDDVMGMISDADLFM